MMLLLKKSGNKMWEKSKGNRKGIFSIFYSETINKNSYF